MTVQDLGALFTWTQPSISRHLSILVRVGLITKSKEGSYVFYAIANTRIFALCDTVCRHVQTTLEGYGKP